ncbi:MAG: aminotransferase, partial [Flavobacteriaceae bacterium]|nr:aminotransferase [Flavobacteriaceae bacterium]
MRKREFIRTITMGALAAPLSSSALYNVLSSAPFTSVSALTENEDFWRKIRGDYVLKPEYINLESGYYNIIPIPTLNAMI